MSGEILNRLVPMVLGTNREQRLSILSYHRVLEHPDPMRSADPTEDKFSWQMEVLSRYFNPLTLSEAVERMQRGDLPERAVVVTFDDGYADNLTVALPILQRWQVPATVFVATRFLDGGAMWNDLVIESVRAMTGGSLALADIGLDDAMPVSAENQARVAQQLLVSIKHWEPPRRAAAVDYIHSLAGRPKVDLMLTGDQVRRLHAGGVEIGGHTHSHPILVSLSEEEAEAEIRTGKSRLEELLGKEVKVFAYPNGRRGSDFADVHSRMVKNAGFIAAVTTEMGVSSDRSDYYQLPRFTPWELTPLRFMLRLHLARRNVMVPDGRAG